MSSRDSFFSIQCGVGGCRAPEVPGPFTLPEFENPLWWNENDWPPWARGKKAPMPIYIN